MKTGKIYGLVCPIDKTIRYVGQTTRTLQQRLVSHLGCANSFKGRFNRKDGWLKELKSQNLVCEIVLLEECSLNIINEREIHWIAELKKSSDLLNFAEGGSGQTEIVRQKMSEERKGDKNPMFGKRFTMSDEHRQKIGESLRKSSRLKESRNTEKFKESVRKTHAIAVVTVDVSDNFHKEFSSMAECAKYFGYTVGNIKNACRFKRLIGKGKEFKYKVVRKDEYFN